MCEITRKSSHYDAVKTVTLALAEILLGHGKRGTTMWDLDGGRSTSI